MNSLLRIGGVVAMAALLSASVAEGRGGGGGGGGGGGRGGGGGGGGRGWGAPPSSGAARGYGNGATGGGKGFGKGKSATNTQALAELEDRKALIADARRRALADDREANQEARLAAGRLDSAAQRANTDIR